MNIQGKQKSFQNKNAKVEMKNAIEIMEDKLGEIPKR